jgi:two-component system chemotaxis sensor kinase CheA
VRKKRILFLDNRPEHMHQPALRLQVEGYEVHEVTTEEAGLGELHRKSYDLVILDAELPDNDGWKVLSDLRADPDFGETKVIVLMAPKGETGKLALIPVDAELRRPFTMAELVDSVKRVLGD